MHDGTDEAYGAMSEGAPPPHGRTAQTKGTARIVDVARRAQVSPATVSRVFNGSRGVKALHRERVLRAIDELDYRPNLLARNLRRQKAGMIGVLVSDIENPHFTAMVRAVEDATYRRGYRVLLCNTDESADKQRAYLEMLAAERALGVILAPSDPAGQEIATLLDLGIPVVAFDRPVDDPRADAVVADNRDAGRRATDYLRAAGHARIGFIGDAGVATCVARQAGYEEVLRAANLPLRIADGRSRIAGGAAAVEELVRDEEPTALVVANNLMTIGALRVLRAARARSDVGRRDRRPLLGRDRRTAADGARTAGAPNGRARRRTVAGAVGDGPHGGAAQCLRVQSNRARVGPKSGRVAGETAAP